MYENNVNHSDYNSKDMYTVFLQDIVKKLSTYEWRAFEIIVASGVSEEKDAKEAVIQALIDNGEPCKSEDTAWRAIKALVKTGLYDAERIFTGYRNFNILKLTVLGTRIYRDRFRKEPPYQEHELLMKEHASIKVYLYSLTDFAKGQITYYYDMMSDEPVCYFKKKGK
ncbi:MAG: hypothetical protein IKT46_10130 [Clostridia bacterium]|nr:hypothetical protein [Clostridia bacterium]